MSYSSLATVQIWSPCNSGHRNHTIDSIAIHTMAGNLTAESCGTLFASASTKASSNYGVDSSGTIGVYVDEDDRSWCTSSGGVDHRAVTIEVASTSASEPYECTTAAYESLINLLVDICQRNNIDSLKWKADKDYAIAAANGGPVTEQNMFVHRWFAEKSCPGEYLYSKQGDIANEVNARLGSGVTSTATTSASSTTSTTQTLTINWETFNPYLVTLSRDSKPKYNTLKDAKVLGALVEAGYRYQTNHTKTSKFDNPNLETQIKEIEKLGLTYGLYTICRARNSVEAQEEMYYFSFPVRRHPPAMGVWLQLDFGTNKNTNNNLLRRYKSDLTRLGFKGKMGIICTRSTIERIDWDSYQDDFYLWLVDHIDDTTELDQLLDPEFFDVDGEG